MQTRHDHVHAYHFAVGRLSTALTGADIGTATAPFRRAGVGVVLGIVLAAVLCLVAVIVGWLDPAASTAWRQDKAIIVEKETGTRFVYLDGVLHPTLNYTSARLISGSSATVDYVPRRDLAGVPIGSTLGIEDAPDNLPLASALLPDRWTVCLAPGQSGGVTLSLPGRSATALGSARALVTGSNGKDYVIWHDTKYPVQEQSALVTLGFGNVQPTPASSVWLDTLPTGSNLAPPAHLATGQAGPMVAGRKSQVGDLYDSIAAGVTQYYVALSDGLAPMSRTELALMSALPGAPSPAQVSPADIAAAPVSANRSLLSFLPGLLTGALFQPGSTASNLCVQQDSPGRTSRSTVVTEPAASSPVSVPAGAGAIVQAPTPRSQFATEAQQYLVTSSGEKYPLATGALQALGFPSSAVRVMPASILQLIPDGPLLSGAMAARAVSWN